MRRSYNVIFNLSGKTDSLFGVDIEDVVESIADEDSIIIGYIDTCAEGYFEYLPYSDSIGSYGEMIKTAYPNLWNNGIDDDFRNYIWNAIDSLRVGDDFTVGDEFANAVVTRVAANESFKRANRTAKRKIHR